MESGRFREPQALAAGFATSTGGERLAASIAPQFAAFQFERGAVRLVSIANAKSVEQMIGQIQADAHKTLAAEYVQAAFKQLKSADR